MMMRTVQEDARRELSPLFTVGCRMGTYLLRCIFRPSVELVTRGAIDPASGVERSLATFALDDHTSAEKADPGDDALDDATSGCKLIATTASDF